MQRVKLRIMDSRYRGLRTHTNSSIGVCNVMKTTTTGYLWWKKKTVSVVYGVMLAKEDESYDPFCSPLTDYYWSLIKTFDVFKDAQDFKNLIIETSEGVENGKQ